ncbi:glycosyltransferase family 4 protein [Phenylobacterium sp. J426]|uniref:glycosyltransferase family 4 protein n=1 Tax=Phenylobacterium sp. J426 TaxID=2898439 RepID=UPI002151D96C|nr:glycosyltransferase family 4 protein [Phenylobacterium sp. J426]MCR5876144.1 glycosyltransferase family 4 protein [Phenylobacterium sp. J426]
MRVLMTADAVGGVWTYALDLARALGGAGVRTTLAVVGPAPSPDQVRAAHAVPGLTLLETGLPLDWMATEPAEILEVGAALRGLARGVRADLIHLNSPAFASVGDFPAPVVGVCHSCLATWWSAVKDGPMPADFRWRTQALWQGLHACDALIAPTRAFADETAAAYDLPRPHAVWNGRNPGAAKASHRERMVFTSGRLWDEGKNLAVLDEAASLMSAPLHAAGPEQGPNDAGVRLKHARVLGRLSSHDVAEWLARAPVYASSALYEPFGLGVLEAAQAGCALVLSDIPTFRELWDEAAVFIDPTDARGFAAALEQLVDDAAGREALAAKALARAQRYSVEAMTSGVLDLYRQLHPELAAA